MPRNETPEHMSLVGKAPHMGKAEKMHVRQKLLQYIEQGLTDKQIITTLNLNPQTYYRLLRGMQSEMNIRFGNESAGFIYKWAKRMEARIFEAHLNYNKALEGKRSDAVEWFRQARETDNDYFDRLQRMGVIKQAPERFEIAQTVYTIKRPDWLEGEVVNAESGRVVGTASPAVRVPEKQKQI